MTEWLRNRPFAHRGLHGPDTGPENSLAAFEAAVAQGYGIECDLRLLAERITIGETVLIPPLASARRRAGQQTI